MEELGVRVDAVGTTPERGGNGRLLVALRGDARLVAAVVSAGALVGALLPGVGGRLAMRLLVLTSDPSVQGMVSDDGFVIGQVDLWLSLRFVLVEGVPTGVAAALAWLVVRPLLAGPPWSQHLAFGGSLGLFFGSSTVHVDGVDFTALGPVWLSILLFGVGPVVVFAVSSVAAERVSRSSSWFRTAPERRALAPLLVFLVSPFLLPLLGLAAAVSVSRHLVLRTPGLAWVRATHPLWAWAGRLALASLFAYSVVSLASKAVELSTLGG